MQRWGLLLITAALFTLFQSNNANASRFIPSYSPGGSLSPINVKDALLPIKQTTGSSWWYLGGLLKDSNQQAHSLQLTLIQKKFLNTLYGIGSIGFTFQNNLGKTVYLWNIYSDPTMILHYSIAPLQYIAKANPHFDLHITSSKNDSFNPFFYDIRQNSKKNLGQIGTHYFVKAQGFGEVGVKQNNSEFIKYDLQMNLVDQRGLVPEGLNGFVDGQSFHSKTNFNTSWEFGMPNLKVENWTLRITPVRKINRQSLIQHTLTFRNNISDSNRIWLDRQMLNNTHSHNLQNMIVAYQTKASSVVATDSPLYTGTWMSFCLDKKPFQGLCGVAVAFWNNNIPTAEMNSDRNSIGGFMNLYTRDSNDQGFPVQVGSTLTEILSIDKDQKDLPYQIKNDPTSIFQSPYSQHHYAQTVIVSLRTNSLFANVFNSFIPNAFLVHHWTLKFQALSTQTENVILNQNDAFYEGAATVSLCNDDGCTPFGTGFMEQMGYM